MNFSSVGGDDFLAVRSEGVVGKEVAGEERFLIVALDGIFEPVLLAAIEITDAESGFGFGAGGVDEKLAVRRDLRTHGAAGRIGDGVFFAGDEIAADDLREREDDVVKALWLDAAKRNRGSGRLWREKRRGR